MSDLERALVTLPAKSVRTILDELNAIRKRAIAGEEDRVPLVTLHLRSGHEVNGWIVDIAEDKHGSSMVLHSPGADLRHPALDALYVDPGSVEAITVHSAAEIAQLLSFGKHDSPPGVAPPSRGDIRGSAEKAGRAISELLGTTVSFEVGFEGMPETTDAMNTVSSTVREVGVVLNEIARGEKGKASLVRALRKVHIVDGLCPAVKLDAGLLVVTIAASRGKDGRMIGTDLRAAIEKVF